MEERREALVERDPGLEGSALVAVERDADADRVLPLDPEPRVKDPLGPVAVVRQDQEPL